MEALAVLLPLAAAFVAGLFGRFIGDRGAQIVTCGAVVAAAVLSVLLFIDVGLHGNPRTVALFPWFASGSFEVPLPLGPYQLHEIFLTAAQSLLAVALLASLSLGPGAAILLAAGPDERAQADAVRAALPGATFVDAVGLGLVETAACLARASLVVGNDSGLMHLSAAMGAPTLGLFGPTDERRYAPFGPRAGFVRGLRSYAELEPDDRAGHTTSLMDDLSVEAAYSAALSLLS